MQKMNRLTDEMLVKAYANGDNKAFDTLLRRHQTRVFTYILNIIKNKDVADDKPFRPAERLLNMK